MLTAVVRWIGKNLGTLLLAFALALVVWVSSVIAADPNQECSAPRAIPIDVLGQHPSLERVDDIPEQLQIQFFAPRSVCDRLLEEGVSNAVVDLTGLTSGTYVLEVELPPITLSPLRIQRYSPQEVTVTLERIVSNTYPVNITLAGEPALGFQASAPNLDPSEVVVSGPESQVSKISEIGVALDISGARETIRRTIGLQPLDGDGEVVEDVIVTPNRVQVIVPVTQLGRYRELAVQVKTTGQWARGHRLTNISVSPPTVTVFSADLDLINSLPGFVETIPIDLTDANDDVEENVALNLPEDIDLVGRETVFVQVGIAAIEGNLIVTLPVEVIGLSPEFALDISPASVEVNLVGPLPVLETLTPANVRVVVDVTGLEEGSWQLIPLVDILPDGVGEQGINPGTVEVTLSLLPTPTPSAGPDGTATPSS